MASLIGEIYQQKKTAIKLGDFAVFYGGNQRMIERNLSFDACNEAEPIKLKVAFQSYSSKCALSPLPSIANTFDRTIFRCEFCQHEIILNLWPQITIKWGTKSDLNGS